MKMTIREAVDTLELNRPFAYSELQNAIDMAIDALKTKISGREYVKKYGECPICVDCPHNCPLDS